MNFFKLTNGTVLMNLHSQCRKISLVHYPGHTWFCHTFIFLNEMITPDCFSLHFPAGMKME